MSTSFYAPMYDYKTGDLIQVVCQGLFKVTQVFQSCIEAFRTSEYYISVPKNYKWYDRFRTTVEKVFRFPESKVIKLHRVQERFSQLQRNKNKRRIYVQRLRESLA